MRDSRYPVLITETFEEDMEGAKKGRVKAKTFTSSSDVREGVCSRKGVKLWEKK